MRTQYKFMTNILTKARNRTQPLAFLSRLGVNHRFSYFKMIVSSVLFVLVFVISMQRITSIPSRVGFVIIPTLLSMILMFYIIATYVWPHRNGTILAHSIKLIKFSFAERQRKKSKKLSTLKTFGIKSFKNGIITFDDGDFGVAYHVNGHLSRSTLPQIADQIAHERSRYFISRTSDSQEKCIISIKPADLESQLDYFRNIYKENLNKTDKISEWKRTMSAINYDYIDSGLKGLEYVVSTVLILRDSGFNKFRKSVDSLEMSVNSGLYSSITIIKTEEELIESLSDITLYSKKGGN